MTRLKKIAWIVFIADVLAVGFVCWVCRPPAGTVISETSSTVYDAFIEYSSPYGVLSDDVFTIKYRKRESVFRFTSTIAKLVDITGSGSVIMVSDSVMFASLSCGSVYRCYTQFLVNLGCDFEKLVMDEYSIPSTKDTMYEYEDGRYIVRLTELEGKQLWFRVRTEGARTVRDLYILGAQNVAVISTGKGTALKLRILWNCQDQPEEFTVPSRPPTS